ncbi:peptidoglycan recognition protein 1-like [Bombina bombina]|uniref:peptidoglycan recognition protein 1-like n=1 Tax=Bombina bombina TaxID=8345 RepID=UPI00235A9717|nr:peptidoglycan recognition protein 1-like [Bombina bombina]
MIRIIAVLLMLCVVTHCCPSVVSRSQWGARSVNCHSWIRKPVGYVIIHHSAGAFCNSPSTCSSQVRNIQNYHIRSNKWCDIGYNFLIGEDGRVYEGRGWHAVGVHARKYNPISYGICFIGTFTNRNPSIAAQNAAKSLIRCGVSRGFIRRNYNLKGHRDANPTSCPGNTFYRTIKSWPQYRA